MPTWQELYETDPWVVQSRVAGTPVMVSSPIGFITREELENDPYVAQARVLGTPRYVNTPVGPLPYWPGEGPVGVLKDLVDSMQRSSSGGGGGGGVSVVPVGEDVVLPPTVAAMTAIAEAEAARRAAARQALETLSTLALRNIPSAMRYYPGFEPGGIADVALGFLTGGGPQRALEVLPEPQRLVERQPLPGGLLSMLENAGPSAEDIFQMARRVAQDVLQSAIRLPRYQAVSTGGGGGGGGGNQSLSVEDWLAILEQSGV